MNRAAAIVTDRGGRTCHAAIIARELGVPAVVGSREATSVLVDEMTVTVSCAEGDTGFVYEGALDYEVQHIELDAMPPVSVKVMMNVANPDRAFEFSRRPDFKSNEYAHLLGGDLFEPIEENPMTGFRGASRYLAAEFADAFALECEALRSVRDDMGFTNVEIMVPFVRTVAQAESVVAALSAHGIERGRNGLRLIMMCEVPSNAILADQFLQLFDGFSIGSNDLTQFTLALDRDSELVAELFEERDPAVKALISKAIDACRAQSKYIGICGQGPSDHIDFAIWLASEGIDSISLNPDTVLETWLALAGS